MLKINSKKLVEILNSKSEVIDVDVFDVSTDSRTAKKGDLFIALSGENFDAHAFVKDVINNGVELVVVNKLVEGVSVNHQILVDNTKKAFAEIGKHNREQFKGKVICLTGSAGKTTTKEEIKFVLSKFAKTYATTGNFNNDVGVPRTLCDLDMDAQYAVIEVGMSSKGEISYLMPYIKPDIAIVTNVYPMHIEFFSDGIEGIAKAKAEIFEGLTSSGTAIINADTECFDILLNGAKAHTNNIIEYGDLNIKSSNENGLSTIANVKLKDIEADFSIPTIGKHYVYNALCALNVVDVLGLDVKKAAEALKGFGAVEGRGKIYELKLPNGSNYTLIDDSYSGQPEAMKFAIENLEKMKTKGRKVAVLGKMAELGDFSKEKHIEIGKALAKTNIDVVITVKPETKDMLAQLNDKFETHYFEDVEGLEDILVNKLLQNNDTVLIKGARYSSKLYKVAEFLIKNGAK